MKVGDLYSYKGVEYQLICFGKSEGYLSSVIWYQNYVIYSDIDGNRYCRDLNDFEDKMVYSGQSDLIFNHIMFELKLAGAARSSYNNLMGRNEKASVLLFARLVDDEFRVSFFSV